MRRARRRGCFRVLALGWGESGRDIQLGHAPAQAASRLRVRREFDRYGGRVRGADERQAG